jgi:hypothetical protein
MSAAGDYSWFALIATTTLASATPIMRFFSSSHVDCQRGFWFLAGFKGVEKDMRMQLFGVGTAQTEIDLETQGNLFSPQCRMCLWFSLKIGPHSAFFGAMWMILTKC